MRDAGQKVPPSPLPGSSVPGSAAASSVLAHAFSASRVARLPTSRCAGRAWQPLPPFGRDATAPLGKGQGLSHPSRKATVPRPLHLGPICCRWLPSLPPALNSDVFKHTSKAPGSRRGAPARSTVPSTSRKWGAASARERECAGLLPAQPRRREGGSAAGATLLGIPSAVTGSTPGPHRKWLGVGRGEEITNLGGDFFHHFQREFTQTPTADTTTPPPAPGPRCPLGHRNPRSYRQGGGKAEPKH